MLNEFYRIAFRKKLYGSIAELQADLDQWLEEFNRRRPHQGRWCFGKTPLQTFLDAKPIAEEKMIAAWQPQQAKPGRPVKRPLSDQVLAYTAMCMR
jgi:hypothetical protein